jgi:hypothetical protein
VVERKVDVMDLTNEPTMSISYILNHYVWYVTSYEQVVSVRVCIRMIYHREISYWRNSAANVSSTGFGILKVVVTRSFVFWDTMPCIPLKINRRFGATCRLHHHVQRIGPARNQHETGRKNNSACQTLHVGFLFPSIFVPQDGGDIFLRNVGWLSVNYAALYPNISSVQAGPLLIRSHTRTKAKCPLCILTYTGLRQTKKCLKKLHILSQTLRLWEVVPRCINSRLTLFKLAV